ncbi:MAG: VOC family protein [Anaerolineae bacterium]|nr:VOC family protein [Anaerolineae bacterium]
MTTISLPDSAHIDSVHLRVISLERALAFYRDILGFAVVQQDSATVALAASPDEPPIITLTEHPGAQRKPQRSTGLYHVAILMPERPALARLLRRLLVRRYPLGGASDHGVSEALYLSDPDGNGLEIYRDRPRAEWRMDGDQVAMVTEALDLDNLLAEASEQDSGVAPGTIIGHVHLHVADLDRAEAFYGGRLGFDMMMRATQYGAYFMAAGGYHHHLGLNIWAGRTPPPANAVGLESFTVAIPGEAAWRQVVERTGATVSGGIASVTDPDGTTILLKCV